MKEKKSFIYLFIYFALFRNKCLIEYITVLVSSDLRRYVNTVCGQAILSNSVYNCMNTTYSSPSSVMFHNWLFLNTALDTIHQPLNHGFDAISVCCWLKRRSGTIWPKLNPFSFITEGFRSASDEGKREKKLESSIFSMSLSVSLQQCFVCPDWWMVSLRLEAFVQPSLRAAAFVRSFFTFYPAQTKRSL